MRLLLEQDIQILRGVEPLFGTRDENIRLLESELNVRTRSQAVALASRGRCPVAVVRGGGSPTGPVLTKVRIKSTGDLNTWQTFSAPLDYQGSKRLYLVIKQLDNGPVIPFIGYGALNWVSFSGTGTKESK